MAATCTQAQINASNKNSTPTTPTHGHSFSNFNDFRINDFDAPQSNSLSSASSSSSSSSSSPSTSSPCTNMSSYSNPSKVNGDNDLVEVNSKNFTQLNNDLTITNNTNVSMKRILQEINNNSNSSSNNGNNTNGGGNSSISASNINSNKSNDSFFDMMINGNSNANGQRAASFNFFENESPQISPYFNQHEQLNLKENLNNLMGSFINNGNQKNHFFPQNILSQSFIDSKLESSVSNTQQMQDVFNQQENISSSSNNNQRIKDEHDFLANCMRKRVYSCSTVDFEFLNKARALSESINANNSVNPIASSPAHDSSNNRSNFIRQSSLASDTGDEILASSIRSSIMQSTSNNAENFKSFRHNSIIGTNSFNNNIPNSNNTTNSNNSSVNPEPFTKENRALSFSFSSNSNNQNSNFMHINKTPVFNQSYFNKNEISNHPNTFPCLSPNCMVLSTDQNEGNFDQNLIRFGCNSCQTIRYMHGLCYKKSCLEQLNMNNSQRNNNNNKFNPSKSFDGNKYQEHQIKMITIRFSCTSCMNGVLFKHQSLPKSNTPTTSPLATSSNHHHQQQNFEQSNNNNGINMPWRKKSFCSNNPPLPVPMQPVRETSSRSPSPTNHTHQPSAYPNHSNQSGKLNGHNQLNKRQSAPVNVPKNRCRTMSTGSTSSFSASSSFSSSVGGASFSIGSPLNPNMNAGGTALWKKGANQHVSPHINNNNNSNHHLSSNNLNNTNGNNSNSQEASIKTDAECLNNMLATMSSKLHLTDTGSLEEKLAATGNIFYSRGDDYSIFNKVPFIKQNAIMLRLEDEGPYGNDETRCFVLSHFSSLCIREMKCVICDCKLAIYDKFPLLDGTLFVSPIKYTDLKSYADDSGNRSDKKETLLPLDQEENTGSYLTVPAYVSNKNQFIYAICLNCLHSKNEHEIRCKFCKQAWKGGQTLQIGTMYKYEIFSAFPCCQKKLNCSKCDFQLVNLNTTGGLQYFSSYSEEKECAKCKTKDFHFIKPLKIFYDSFKS